MPKWGKPFFCCGLFFWIAFPHAGPAAGPCPEPESVVAERGRTTEAESGTKKETAAVNRLDNIDWRLTELGGRPVKSGERPVGVRFHGPDRRLQGFAGCNSFSGLAEAGERTLRITRIRATRKACAHGMNLERAFLRALESIITYERHNGILELHSGRGVEMRFQAGDD